MYIYLSIYIYTNVCKIGLQISFLNLRQILQFFHSNRNLLNSLIAVVQLLSHVQLFATLWTAVCQASLSFTISQSLLKLISIELVMPSNHFVLCHPLQSFPASGSFPMSQLFTSGGQTIGASASASALLMNSQFIDTSA